MRVRRLAVGPDGTAEVLLLTDPIPRHVSLVDWGANDQPAVSWKTADPTAAHLVLRSPPSGKVASATSVDGPVLREFIIETLDAWASCFDAVLASPLQSGDRAAQVQALTVQAGARIAAALKILGPAAAVAASAHKAAGLKVPEVPSASTLQGEIDRRRLRSAIEGASAFLLDASLEAAKLATGATEVILASFAEVASAFGAALSSLPAGVVGAAPAATRRSAPTRILEIDMNPTLAQLQAIAEADPVGFLKMIKSAVTAAQKTGTEGVQVAKKFMWGETGVDPYDPGGILAGLASFQDGVALQAVIANAVGGIDANKAVGSGVTVAATMRKAQVGLLVAELKTAPNGELAAAIKEALAEDIAGAVVETVRRALDAGHGGGSPSLDFEPEEGTDVSLVPDLPGALARM